MTKRIGDMSLAAALLAYDTELKDINKSNKNRQLFEFSDPVPFIFILDHETPIKVMRPTIDQVETFFISQMLMFPPSYPDSLRRIKSSIHSDSYD